MSKDYEEFMEKSIAKSADLVNEEIQVTIDISMYPNKEDFIPPIKGFIKTINTYSNLKITTFPTSTVIQGEYHHAMNSVKETILICQQEFNNAVYVMKVIPDYKALD
jgi:uncharacterized protein YqgV (UPF0045/DUF77 family)